MELRKTDSEDLPRANCTGAVHTDAPDRSFCLSRRATNGIAPMSYGCILKLQLGQRASRLTEFSSLLNCICIRESYLHFAIKADTLVCEYQYDFRKTQRLQTLNVCVCVDRPLKFSRRKQFRSFSASLNFTSESMDKLQTVGYI